VRPVVAHTQSHDAGRRANADALSTTGAFRILIRVPFAAKTRRV
jgi:hypothetical protein